MNPTSDYLGESIAFHFPTLRNGGQRHKIVSGQRGRDHWPLWWCWSPLWWWWWPLWWWWWLRRQRAGKSGDHILAQVGGGLVKRSDPSDKCNHRAANTSCKWNHTWMKTQVLWDEPGGIHVARLARHPDLEKICSMSIMLTMSAASKSASWLMLVTCTGVVTLLWQSFQVASPFCTLMYSLRQLRIFRGQNYLFSLKIWCMHANVPLLLNKYQSDDIEGGDFESDDFEGGDFESGETWQRENFLRFLSQQRKLSNKDRIFTGTSRGKYSQDH